MSDYRVKVTVRNDRLLRAIESKGYVAGQKFAEAVGVSYVTINDLVSLKQSAIGRDGELRPAVEKLCAFLGAMPSELFTESALCVGVDAGQEVAGLVVGEGGQVNHDCS